MESLLNYCCANIFYLDHIKNLVTFFGTHNTCLIKAFVTNTSAIVQSSNKSVLRKERKNDFLGLIEVSINTMYKHVKANENILRIGGKEKKRTHTIFSSHSYIPATCSHFPTNMDAPS